MPPGGRASTFTADQLGVLQQADTEHKSSSWMVEAWANSRIGQTKEQGAIALEYAAASPDVNGKCMTVCDRSLATVQ